VSKKNKRIALAACASLGVTSVAFAIALFAADSPTGWLAVGVAALLLVVAFLVSTADNN
jgi:hypothetical protein